AAHRTKSRDAGVDPDGFAAVYRRNELTPPVLASPTEVWGVLEISRMPLNGPLYNRTARATGARDGERIVCDGHAARDTRNCQRDEYVRTQPSEVRPGLFADPGA